MGGRERLLRARELLDSIAQGEPGAHAGYWLERSALATALGEPGPAATYREKGRELLAR